MKKGFVITENYRRLAEAQKAVKKLMDDGTPAQSDALVRGALRMLSQG